MLFFSGDYEIHPQSIFVVFRKILLETLIIPFKSFGYIGSEVSLNDVAHWVLKTTASFRFTEVEAQKLRSMSNVAEEYFSN